MANFHKFNAWVWLRESGLCRHGSWSHRRQRTVAPGGHLRDALQQVAIRAGHQRGVGQWPVAVSMDMK